MAEQPVCHNFETIHDLSRVDWLYSMLIAALGVQDTARHWLQAAFALAEAATQQAAFALQQPLPWQKNNPLQKACKTLRASIVRAIRSGSRHSTARAVAQNT